MRLSALAVALIALALPAAAQTVVDGDTLKLNGTTYRLWGIDAPETHQVCSDGWLSWSSPPTPQHSLPGGRYLSMLKKPFGHGIALPVKTATRRYSAIDQSAGRLRGGLAACVLSAPGSERRNCGSRRRPDRGGGAGSVTANGSGRATLVAMVQAADLWEGDNGAGGGRLPSEARSARLVIGWVARFWPTSPVARPDTLLGWYRKLVARKFDGSARRGPGRPRIKGEVEELIIRMASQNRGWGYDRIAGALANLGHEVSDQTVGNVLRRHGLPAAPERQRTTTWVAFVRTHLALLAGTDFFTAEVLTLRGLVTYYVLLFIHLESRRVDIAGITVHPDKLWMKQIARNAAMEDCGALQDCRYLLHDRDTKFTRSFRAILVSGRVKPLAPPACSPNLNAYAERWVRSVKEECLSKDPVRRALVAAGAERIR